MKLFLSLAVLLFIVFTGNAQTYRKANADDKPILVLKDSSQIVIDSSVQDKMFWQTLIVSQDTGFLNFFKKDTSNTAYYLYISSIEKRSPFEYIFVAYCRPLKLDPSSLISFGYATYHVYTTSQIIQTPRVNRVEFIGVQI